MELEINDCSVRCCGCVSKDAQIASLTAEVAAHVDANVQLTAENADLKRQLEERNEAFQVAGLMLEIAREEARHNLALANAARPAASATLEGK
jgi:regulator of replication initiation timing